MKNRTALTTFILAFLFQFGIAQNTTDFFSKADTFFKTYVKNGRVDYRSLKENPDSLNELIDLTNAISVSESDKATYQAFWINGYNLSVIKGIVDNYPIKSPLDKAGFFDKTKHNIGGKSITLNDIENKLLRGNFPKEARFHFVLVCAGLGCPPIISNAYFPNILDSQLQKQTELALNNPNFIKVKGKKVQLSQLFEWYKGDFTQGGKSQIDFVNQYRNEKIDSGAKVGYYAYDWTLNEIK
ncbi:hypothetical protein MTsPCn9_19700 [Croceitalea sp. MTPC9]|uniref:DUF547 domain-containing protein n=1 Tax=unclassified Croceitalea TaxID=2632280 RepID=UPI002B367585|nr:hypothetical protein MTsPCn6_12550 [Croceitalea sp. MTPC6]GMN17034.1 hypothetical protein MTsPCn9_19700 [Croceitalea sp. MTPC9]